MLGAIITLVISIYVASKTKTQIRYALFPALVLVLLPVTAYILVGTSQYLSTMSGQQIVKDMGSITLQCVREPFTLIGLTPGTPNIALALTGMLVLISVGVAVAQFVGHISRQKDVKH